MVVSDVDDILKLDIRIDVDVLRVHVKGVDDMIICIFFI